MDFIIGFPKKSRQHGSIMVVVDMLTKFAHFIPVKTMYLLTQLPENPQYEHFYANVSNPNWDPSSGLMNDDGSQFGFETLA